MFKRSILFPILVIISLLVGAFVATYYWEHEQTDRRDMQRRLGSVQDLYSLGVQQEVHLLQGIATVISRDGPLRQAYLSRDRERLLEESAPLFDQLRQHNPITHFYFIEPDGRVFLRVHKPDLSGDLIDRWTLRQALESGRGAAGIEFGPLGTLTLRVVTPWVVDGELLGYLELGQETERLLDRVRDTLGIELLLFADEHALPAPQKSPAVRVGPMALVHSTLAEGEVAAVAETILQDSPRQVDHELHVGSRSMRAGAMSLAGPDGLPVGRLVILEDVTARHEHTGQMLFIIVITALAVVIGLFLLFSRIIGKVERQVAVTQEELEQKVAQRTEELVQEVEERRRIEARLTLLFRAVEQSPASVVITDVRGNIEYVNPKFTKLTGYTAEEVIGRNPRFLKSGTKETDEYRKLWQTIRGGNDWRGEFRNLRKDGTPFCESASISPVRAQNGEISHFIAVKEDITQRKQAEAQASRLQEELAHMDRLSLLGEMAATLAHEVNQPLATIVNFAGGCIQRIKAGNTDPEPLLFALDKISSQGKLAGEIIRKMRSFVSKGKPSTAAVDLSELARQALELLSVQAQREQVEVVFEAEPHLPRVPADAIQIQQVLLNLMLNAVQAMTDTAPEEKRLDVRIERDPAGGVAVVVSDRGPGVQQAELEKLFRPFYTTKSDGMGMGLAICRTIIEAHGGDIGVGPSPQGGLSFRFVLPEDAEVDQDAA